MSVQRTTALVNVYPCVFVCGCVGMHLIC